MIKSWVQWLLALAVVMSLLVSGTWPAAALAGQGSEAEPIYLRLKYATFDPLQGLPEIPPGQAVDAYPGDGSGLYIVQFEGPVQEAWKEQVRALGGRMLDYLPDYAFLVWMDANARAGVEALDAVRWAGIYQPAYKVSPAYDGAPLVRVSLAEGANLAAVERRLAGMGVTEARVESKEFTVFLSDGDVTELAALPEVLWIEDRPIYQLYNDIAGGIMGAATAWAAGLDGSGMTITVADTGVDSGVDGAAAGDMHPDLDNRFAAISSWPADDGCAGCCFANNGANDGASDLDSGHGTHVIGSVAGNGAASSGLFRGLAPQATLTFQAVEQYVQLTPYCQSIYGTSAGYLLAGIPDNLNSLFQESYNWGSRIHSNSWGGPTGGTITPEYGGYTDNASQVDEFVWNHPDMMILFSAGNSGVDDDWDGYVDEDSIGSPGTAKNAITSGASDNERSSGGLNPDGPCSTWYECWGFDFPANPTKDDRISDTRQELAAFSSRGPTDDGRIKPDLVAPGTNILSTRSQSASGNLWGDYLPNSYYVYSGGTSMSNPLIAGAAALVREYYVEKMTHSPSAALIKATLINSAVDISGYGVAAKEAGQPIPNNHEGWGLVDVGAATTGSRRFHDGDTVSTGTNQTYSFNIGSNTPPFKASLVWSDYPGSTAASKALVNDLDLVVEGPGVTYHGNRFSGGWSTAGSTRDTTNNVENVYVQNPAPGTWTVRVEGTNVPQGPQPFALVVTGQFGAPPVYDEYVYLPLVVRQYVPTIPGTAPAAPNLQLISNADLDGNYTVSWSASAGATSYLLQEDDNASFTSPTTAYSGGAVSAAITGKADGTYYYRASASNAYGTSGWSNTQSVTVSAATSGPRPGYWEGQGLWFNVTAGGTAVENFTIYFTVTGCPGTHSATLAGPIPIVGNAFSFMGTYYGSGTFGTDTTCSGQVGLDGYYVPACSGYVYGGPWSYSAAWVSSQAASDSPTGAIPVQVFPAATLESE